MKRTKTQGRNKILRRTAPIAFVAILGVGAAACGSSGGGTRTQSPAAPTAPANTPTTAAPQSGGAGF
jgi:hypothetical protein